MEWNFVKEHIFLQVLLKVSVLSNEFLWGASKLCLDRPMVKVQKEPNLSKYGIHIEIFNVHYYFGL